MSLQPHERILPAFDISEEGLRQLEIWLLDRLGRGGGLQYHKGIYGPHNIGDWLSVETTSLFTPDHQNARMQDGNPGMLFKADSHNAAGAGIVLWSHDDVIARDPVWQLYPGGLIYFLDGEMDLGYTEGGQILRYSGGGQIVFYTSDPDRANSGGFQVITSGTTNDAAITTGDIALGTTNTVGSAGTIKLLANGSTPGGIVFSTIAEGDLLSVPAGSVLTALDSGGQFAVTQAFPGGVLYEVDEDSTTTHNLGNGKTLVINDHLGSPLVTYTG